MQKAPLFCVPRERPAVFMPGRCGRDGWWTSGPRVPCAGLTGSGGGHLYREEQVLGPGQASGLGPQGSAFWVALAASRFGK